MARKHCDLLLMHADDVVYKQVLLIGAPICCADRGRCWCVVQDGTDSGGENKRRPFQDRCDSWPRRRGSDYEAAAQEAPELMPVRPSPYSHESLEQRQTSRLGAAKGP